MSGGNTHIDTYGGAGGIYLNWYGGTAGTHIGNGAAGLGDLYARNLNVTNNICFSGNCYNEAQVVGGTAIDTGSFLHPSASWVTLNNNYIPKSGNFPGDKNGVVNSNLYDDGNKVTIGKLNNTTVDINGNVGSTALTVNGGVAVTENVTANGFIYRSDRRLKDDITPLSGSLGKILKLNGYSYTWKSTGKADIGVIAQEVETVYPELVHTNSEGMKSVEYANLIAPLIEAIKTQQTEIQALQDEVATLKASK